MFLAMNKFKVDAAQFEIFETIWSKRDSKLKEMKGFQSFKLLKAQEKDGSIIYASHVFWDCREDFEAWTNSEQFKQAHKNSKMPKGVILGPPNFESYDVVLGE